MEVKKSWKRKRRGLEEEKRLEEEQRINRYISSTIKIGNLEVMTEDLGEMNWDDAMKACADLGDGWRLPTKDELNLLYENKEKIGGFAMPTIGVLRRTITHAWLQSFTDGYQTTATLSSPQLCARCSGFLTIYPFIYLTIL